MEKMNDIEPYELVKEIRKNVEVVDSSFEKFGLEVISVGIAPHDDGEFDFIIELNKKKNIELDNDLKIKINCYDDEDGIIYTDEIEIWYHEYNILSEYEVFTKECYRKKLLPNIKKVKLIAI